MKTLYVLLVASLMTGAALFNPGHAFRAMPGSELTAPVTADADEPDIFDCEIKVKGTYEGVEYDLTISIFDVTGFECVRLKVALLAALF